jgi:hypothetical protein
LVDAMSRDLSSVMPVSAVISAVIGTDGSLKAAKVSLTPAMRPSER